MLLNRLVGPPSIHQMMWCSSQKVIGARQPGKVQPWSRSAAARRIARGQVLLARPMSRTPLGPPSTTGRMLASQASRRIVPASRGRSWPGEPMLPVPIPECRVCQSMVIWIKGLLPLMFGS